MISNLNALAKYPINKEYSEKLYNHLSGAVWWNDSRYTNEAERAKYLYEDFIKYYELISNGQIREIEKDQEKAKELRYWLINLCKLQLDVELNKI